MVTAAAELRTFSKMRETERNGPRLTDTQHRSEDRSLNSHSLTHTHRWKHNFIHLCGVTDSTYNLCSSGYTRRQCSVEQVEGAVERERERNVCGSLYTLVMFLAALKYCTVPTELWLFPTHSTHTFTTHTHTHTIGYTLQISFTHSLWHIFMVQPHSYG